MSRLVFYHPAPEWTGLARIFVELGRTLATRGVTVAMACPRESPVASVAEAMGFTLLHADVRGTWLADGARLAGILRDFAADAVMVGGDEEQLVAAWAVRRSGRGAVLRRMRTGIATPITVSTKLAVRLAPTWFMHSSATEAQAAEPVKQLRGRLIADLAIDPLQFERVIAAPTPIGTSTIAIVTGPESQRATAAALRTVAALRSRGHPIRALLLGHPHDQNEVRVHATALGLGDSLTMLGDMADRAALIAAADLVWVVADYDDGGIAALDAMALGCAVVATRGTVAERYVRHAETGIVAERDDALASAALITLLQSDATVLSELGNAARADIRAKRGLSTAGDAIMKVLEHAGSAQAAA
jgi:glycosyltransferase involved in cell wall biosynthesis